MDKAPQFGRSRLRPLAIVLLVPTALWSLIFVFVPPGQQDFPLGDDWAYARSAFTLARGDGLDYYNWASMTLLGQLVWAMPFIGLLGESHLALRLGTMVAALLGLAAFFDLLRNEAGLATHRAVVATLCLALNPLFFVLGATFNTDVPVLAFSLVSLALYTRALRGGSPGWWAGGAFAALLAVSTRQNAIVVPVVAGVLLARQIDLRKKPLWLSGVLVPLAAGVTGHFWLGQRDDVIRVGVEWNSITRLPFLVFFAPLMLGLSCLPLLAGRPIRAWRSFMWMLIVLADVAYLLAVFEAPRYGGLFPYLGNWLTPWGIFGKPPELVPGDQPLLLSTGAQAALTVLGCVAGAALAACLMESGGRMLARRPLLLFTFLHIPFLLISPQLFDRYFLVLLPGGLDVAAAGPDGRFRRVAEVGVLCLMGAISFGLLHDLFAWNAARWALGRRAVAGGIAPADIEGGGEWDGWYSERAAPIIGVRPPRGLVLPLNRRFFDHLTGRYALSFSELPATRTLDSEPYRLWLIPGEYRFYLIEADTPTEGSPRDKVE